MENLKFIQKTIFMKYNKKNHLNLLKYSQKLKQEGKNIYDESREDFFALRDYRAMMISHLNWQNREHYYELIEEFLNGPINFFDNELQYQIREKYRSISDAVKRLEAELIFLDPVEPYQKAFEFTALIDNIVSLFYAYCHLNESDEFSEEKLRDFSRIEFGYLYIIKIIIDVVIEINRL